MWGGTDFPASTRVWSSREAPFIGVKNWRKAPQGPGEAPCSSGEKRAIVPSCCRTRRKEEVVLLPSPAKPGPESFVGFRSRSLLSAGFCRGHTHLHTGLSCVSLLAQWRQQQCDAPVCPEPMGRALLPLPRPCRGAVQGQFPPGCAALLSSRGEQGLAPAQEQQRLGRHRAHRRVLSKPVTKAAAGGGEV